MPPNIKESPPARFSKVFLIYLPSSRKMPSRQLWMRQLFGGLDPTTRRFLILKPVFESAFIAPDGPV
jgi:hypothetical protein